MRKYVVFFIIILIFLFFNRSNQIIVQKQDQSNALNPIDTRPQEFDLKEYSFDPLKTPARSNYDWMQTTSAGCLCFEDKQKFVPYIPPQRVAATPLAPYRFPSVQITNPPAITYVINSAAYTPPVFTPAIYQAARPSFEWAWRGLYRVILTSDGDVIYAKEYTSQAVIRNNDGTITYKNNKYWPK